MLSVWLPLNGDLRNQGLANITATNNGATVDNNGKIGKCYSFDGNDDFISISCSDLYNTFSGGSQPFSIAFWVYHADTTRAIIFGDYGLSGAIGFNVELTTSHQVRFYWNGTPDKHFNVNASVGINTWTHIIITYDGNEICIYKNGVQQSDKYSGTLEAKSKTSGMFYLGRDYRTGTTAFNGKLNDFRIYDHCLSPRECKQVSTALVLHYPLNRGGFGRDNICKIRDVNLTGSDYGAYSTRSYDNEAHIGKIQVTDTNHKWNAWRFGTTDLDTTCVELTTGVNTYTMSVDIKVTNYTTGTIICGFDFRTGNTVPTEAIAVLTKEQCDGSWHRISATLTTNDTKNSQCLWSISSNGTVHGSQTTIEYKNWKLERGDIPTPLVPAPSDDLYSKMGLDNNIVYDVSGYCNNGELYTTDNTASFKYESDSPRYLIATNPHSINSTTNSKNGTAYIRGDCVLTTPSQLTIAFWCYARDSGYGGNTGQGAFCTTTQVGDATGYDYTTSAMNHYDSGVSVNSSDGNGRLRLSIVLKSDEWHHYAFTFDGKNAIAYKDGILVDTKSFSSSVTLGSFSSIIIGLSRAGGVWRRNDNTYSDFRIYATCLSPQDVRDLYAVGASLSDTGVLFSNEVSEV